MPEMLVSVGVDPRVAGTKSHVVGLCGCGPTTALSSWVSSTFGGLATEVYWIATAALATPAMTRKLRV